MKQFLNKKYMDMLLHPGKSDLFAAYFIFCLHSLHLPHQAVAD